MADTAISGLADLATLADDDEFPVLDLSASETKSVTVANLRTSMQSGITSYTDEMARDAIGSALVAGSGISVTVNDGADTITVAAAAASTTVSGIVELATSAETITGTDTVRAVTPAGLAAAVPLGVQPLWADTTYSGVPGVHITRAGPYTWSSVVADRAVWGFFPVLSQVTINTAIVRCTTAGTAAAKVRLGIYRCDSAGKPSTLISDMGEVSCASTGKKEITGLSVTLSPGFYFSVAVANELLSLECRGGVTPYWSNHPVAASHPANGWVGTIFTYGALPSTAPNPTNSANSDIQGILVPVNFRW